MAIRIVLSIETIIVIMTTLTIKTTMAIMNFLTIKTNIHGFCNHTHH